MNKKAPFIKLFYGLKEIRVITSAPGSTTPSRPRRCVVILLIALAALPGFAQDAAALRAGVVKVMSTVDGAADGPRRTGTGFVVKVDGATAYIVTAAHVIEGDHNPKVEFFTRQNSPVAAEVVKLDLRIDLALLKVETVQTPLVLALETTALPDTGDEVIAIGFPQSGGSWLVSKADLAGREGADLILSAAAIDEGNSGGPLIKADRVVGVVLGLQGKFARAIPASMAALTLEGWGIALTTQAPASVAARQPRSGDSPSTAAESAPSAPPRPQTPVPEVASDPIRSAPGSSTPDPGIPAPPIDAKPPTDAQIANSSPEFSWTASNSTYTGQLLLDTSGQLWLRSSGQPWPHDESPVLSSGAALSILGDRYSFNSATYYFDARSAKFKTIPLTLIIRNDNRSAPEYMQICHPTNRCVPPVLDTTEKVFRDNMQSFNLEVAKVALRRMMNR